METKKEQINRLREERHALILAHYYTRPEIQEVADFIGDSLALARKAAETDAPVLVMCGVHFMAETCKLLSPDKIVLEPDPAAGCSLADSCSAQDLAAYKKEHPGYKVISYVNTTAAVKALSDCCVTSGGTGMNCWAGHCLRISKRMPASVATMNCFCSGWVLA